MTGSFPLTRPSSNYLPCHSFSLFSFVTSSVTFLLDVAAVKRQRENIIDRETEVVTRSCREGGLKSLRKLRPESSH